jgi:site-specific DNA recombinase
MKAAIYSRFSTDRQTDSSIADQERICGEYAARQGWRITHRFEDQGISGTAMGNRPGVLSMRDAALAGRFEVLLVSDLSRLARSEDLPPLISRLRFQGVRIIGVQDGFDSSARTARMQAGMSAIMGGEFIEMVRARTYAALETRAKDKRPTGGRAFGYRDGKVDRDAAVIVREIFGRYADGDSAYTISKDLNDRRVPSPGSSWNRTTRRANGWMASGIRVILRNERYRGVVHWNTSEWRKDPDSGKRQRVERPRSEWITHTDDGLRIVSDALFERVQRRMRPAGTDAQVRSGLTPKYLLSGLLRCSVCGAHYVMANAREYGCSSHRLGGACSNGVRISRERVQDVLLARLRRDLLAPESVNTIAQDMQTYYLEQTRAQEARTAEAPRELQDLTARIVRLRERLRAGDPDMAADELQAAIDRAEEKRRGLVDQQPAAKQTAKVLSMLPKAAEAARREIAEALAGNSRASMKARVILRAAYSGKIELVPDEAGGLMAHWNLQTAALLQRVGTGGSGGTIVDLFATAPQIARSSSICYEINA